MADHVAVNYGELQSTVSQFNNQYSTFEQSLAQIKNTVDSLASTWQGDGYNSFQALVFQWHSQVTTLNQTLSEISAQVNKSSAAYSETDSSVSGGFRAH